MNNTRWGRPQTTFQIRKIVFFTATNNQLNGACAWTTSCSPEKKKMEWNKEIWIQTSSDNWKLSRTSTTCSGELFWLYRKKQTHTRIQSNRLSLQTFSDSEGSDFKHSRGWEFHLQSWEYFYICEQMLTKLRFSRVDYKEFGDFLSFMKWINWKFSTPGRMHIVLNWTLCCELTDL